MDSNRWDRIQSVFHGAADLPKSQQRAFLVSACANDESLIADIQALLDEDEKAQQQAFMFGPPPLGPGAPALDGQGLCYSSSCKESL